MKKLNTMGIGPKIGMVAIPWFLISLFLTLYFKGIFTFGAGMKWPLQVAGIVVLAIGLIFYVLTAKSLLTGIRRTQLMTTGTYYLCQNPLYACMILMIVPGISLLLNSWLMLTTSLVAYTLFKINIRSEYREMEEFFGDAYREYRKETPEFWPFPWKKWFGK